MKLWHKIFAVFCAASLFKAMVSSGQSTFQNLDFEAAFPNIQPTSPAGQYAVSTALPRWSVYLGTVQQTQIAYQDYSLGATAVTLLGSGGGSSLFSSISGRYGILLQGGVTATAASIEQTSLVPLLTESIQFEAVNGNAGPLLLSLGGQNIPIVPLGTGPNYTLYGGDVSGFAGYSELLEFSAPEGYNGNNNWNIDNIVFSPNPVPEPATWTLLLCGAGLWGIGKKWRRR